jgi:hypothetical protein
MLTVALSAAVSFVAAASLEPPSCSGLRGVRSFLCNSTFNAGNFSFHESGFDISLSEVACSSITIGNVSSSVSTSPQLRLDVGSIGAYCSTTQFSFRETSFPHISGHGDASFTVGGAALSGGISLTHLEGSAVAASLDASTTLVIGSLKAKIDGPSITVKLIKLLEPLIADYLKHYLPSELISLLKGVIEDPTSWYMGPALLLEMLLLSDSGDGHSRP